jgi:hypothetical protein
MSVRGQNAFNELATFNLLDLRVNLPVATRSSGDVKFSFLVFLPQIVMRAKGIAKDEVTAQLETVNSAYIEMMRHPVPWWQRAGCPIVQRLENLALPDSLITIVRVAKFSQVCDDVWKHVVVRHHEINVEDRLCPQVWHGGAADMFDPQDKPAE